MLVDDIRGGDLIDHPVWTIKSRRTKTDFEVTPVKRLPCKSLDNKLVFVPVCLACGDTYWGMFSNVDISDEKLTRHFITFSLLKGEKWIHLARYFDADYRKRGPAALAKQLKMELNDVFPISYDLSDIVSNPPNWLSGNIPSSPSEKLSLDEIVALAVPPA